MKDLSPKNIFKLTNYCVQYFFHKNYPHLYLTDEQWAEILINDKIKPFHINICTTSMTISRERMLNQFFLVFLNFDLTRFKRILKKANVYVSINFSLDKTLYIDIIYLMLLAYTPSEKDFIPITKIKNIINDKYLNACLYYLSFLYDVKTQAFNQEIFNQDFNKDDFVIALLKHYININVNDYWDPTFITKNITPKEKQINNLIHFLYEKSLQNNIFDRLLFSFSELCKAQNSYKTKNINNIYNFLKENFLNEEKINIRLLYMADVIELLFNNLDFSEEQKHDIIFFLDRIKAYSLLQKIY